HLSRVSHVMLLDLSRSRLFFFFNDPTPTAFYTLSLHDALPIWFEFSLLRRGSFSRARRTFMEYRKGYLSPKTPRSGPRRSSGRTDRKSTRLNSSHRTISYAVFCLKKKNKCRRRSYYSRTIRLAY